MSNLINLYPSTNFHEINLDYIIKLVRENNGLHLDVAGNQLLLKTLDGSTVSTVVVHYAEEAGHADTATNANNATFATNATNATNAGHALTADSATTAGTATTAVTATTAGTATEATHATTADTALLANRATTADSATYADTTGSVDHASNAFEAVANNGNYIRFTKGDNTTVDFTAGYATKASNDYSGNPIRTTYIANVVDNNGTLEFKNGAGNTIVSITPSASVATNDSYNNLIADFIKAITVSSNSNYVTVTHGTGTADTLVIHYSETAWKDTNDNVIKNTYIKDLAVVQDDNSGHYNLVAYNGDNPQAELFRVELIAYRAQIADEATHASTADYATEAGHAVTASSADTATSADIATKDTEDNNITSYVKTATRNNNVITFKDALNNNILEFNLSNASHIDIGFFDKDQTQPDNLFTIPVNQAVVYTVDPVMLSAFGFSSVDAMIKPNVWTGYIDENDQMLTHVPIYYSNGYYYISCFDHTASAIKTFMLYQGTLDTDLTVRRVL